MKPWLALLFVLKCAWAGPMPIVLWHGMGDTCCMPYSLGFFKNYLEKEIPGVYVLSLRIGNSIVEDLENGFFMYPDKQLKYVYNIIAKDAKLQDGFNAIGFSQGSQFLYETINEIIRSKEILIYFAQIRKKFCIMQNRRALVQRYGHKIGPVKNLITLGGQHQGVYGLPHCFALEHESCDYVRKLLNYAAYYSWVQKSLVQATYWHDPLNEVMYKKSSEFLSDINNEMSINQTYVDNLNKLEHFIMVKFDNDSIVQPKETEWFGFYAPGQAKKIISLQQSAIYKKDRLGLRSMDEAGKLVFLSQPGDHLHFTENWFTETIIKPYLI